MKSRSRPRCAPLAGDLPGGDLDTRPTPSSTITRLDRTSISAAFQRGDDLVAGERNTRLRPGTVSPEQAGLAASTATGGEHPGDSVSGDPAGDPRGQRLLS